jgi:hypothetical protein
MIAQTFHGRSFMPWLQAVLALVVAGCFLPVIGMHWGVFLIPLSGLVPFTFKWLRSARWTGRG